MDGADKGAARAVLKVSWKFRQDLSIVCRRFVALVSFCFKAASLVGISRALTCLCQLCPCNWPGVFGHTNQTASSLTGAVTQFCGERLLRYQMQKPWTVWVTMMVLASQSLNPAKGISVTHVASASERRVVWEITNVHTQERNLTSVMTVESVSHRRITWRVINLDTQETNLTSVMTVGNASDTCRLLKVIDCYIQERNLTSVVTVGSVSHRGVTWRVINFCTQERNLTSVMTVGNASDTWRL